jgi:hypothetical protein
MAEAENPETKKSTKTEPSKSGGRKGGTIFPRVTFKQALIYSKKLVSKTAVSPQPEATVLAGVFDNAGSRGKIRISALKQLGLLEGTPVAYKATTLARDIEAAASEEEKRPLLTRALLMSKVYRELYNTFQGDQASKAKIKGRAQQLGVHPDVTEKCTDFFVESAITAGVAVVEGDGVRLLAATDISVPAISNKGSFENGSEEEEEDQFENGAIDKDKTGATAAQTPPVQTGELNNGTDPTLLPRPRTSADVTLNLTIDSSLDGEKLEKQLAALRRYGLI